MTLAFRLEAAIARTALAALRALGPVRASNLGGALAGLIGPALPVSRVADVNMRLALPALDRPARRRLVRAAWQNLGRTVAELPHIAALSETAAGPGYTVVGADWARAAVAQGGPAILFSGHLGNWEVLPRVAATYGMPLASLYRAPGNPLIDALMADLRQRAAGAAVPLFPKGATGARGALAHLRRGGFLAMLIDQKMNDGVAATLFGQPAMTAPALAALALRFRCPVIPAHVERTGPARFIIRCEAPLPLPDSGDRTADIAALTQAVNDRLEQWIRARPEGWLWMHRRWPKTVYR